MRAMVGVCLAGVLAVSLLACAHSPEKTVMTAESPKDANKSAKKDDIELKHIGVNEALSSELLGSGPVGNLFGDAEGFDSKLADAMAGDGDELVVGQGIGGMGMGGVGVGGGGGGGGGGFGRIHGIGGANPSESVVWQGSPTFSGLGAVDEEAVVEALGGGNMVMCQTLFFNDAPQETAEIKVQFTIGSDGQASDVTILNQEVESLVSDCIAEQFGKMSFPNPQGGEVVVNAAMLFEP